ncbi:hypothetical protein EJB05_28571, partial [Eragrostis curvula]
MTVAGLPARGSGKMGDRNESGSVWEHGEKYEAGFRCKYCHGSKKGGGATRFKQHLASRGNDVVHCTFVPKDVRDYYRRELDRTKAKATNRMKEKLRLEDIAMEGNVSGDDDEDDVELNAAIHMSR